MGYVKVKYRKEIERIQLWRSNVYNKMEDYMKINLSSTIKTATLDVETNKLMLNIRAMDMFKNDYCFVCSEELIWDSTEYNVMNGRMFNINNTKQLIESDWVSCCSKCLNKLINKDLIKGG